MPGVFPLEVVIQEVLLHRPTVVRVELREVLQPMNLQVLLSRRNCQIPLRVATKVQGVPTPVSAGEHGYLYLGCTMDGNGSWIQLMALTQLSESQQLWQMSCVTKSGVGASPAGASLPAANPTPPSPSCRTPP